jgi:hypothetical protein
LRLLGGIARIAAMTDTLRIDKVSYIVQKVFWPFTKEELLTVGFDYYIDGKEVDIFQRKSDNIFDKYALLSCAVKQSGRPFDHSRIIKAIGEEFEGTT